MYLKEIQMENFKSFGNKMTVPIFKGFTAITGPNGSGKSNIVDAILFVLGPKSSKVMRAGRLTDLIFNGGKKRKNPAKYCKVSLVFDNTSRKMPVDADEVILTRVIKRAPLKNDPDNYYSYFYINTKAATFSDFVDLLTHARISGDGYNIVKQGDVTSLVEMGSIDRRRIIDDISGISSFDTDIKKAEKEKGDAEQNLERIDIILNEISHQTRTLKKERDDAYRYKELQSSLYETKAKIAIKKKQDVEVQIGEITQQIQSYEQGRKSFDEKRTTLKNEYVKAQKDLEEIEQRIGDAGGEETKDIKEKISQLRTDQVKMDEKINYTKNEIIELKGEEKELSTTLESVTKELEELQKHTIQLHQQFEETQNTLTEKDKELTGIKGKIAQSDDTSMDLTRELVKMREEYNNLQSTLHEQKLKRDRFQDKIEAIEIQIAELQETKQTYEFELKDIDWQQTETSKERGEKQKTLKKCEKELFEKKKQESEFTEQLCDLENIIRRLQREQAKAQAEHEAVQSVHTKYNHAVSAILSARNTGELTGIHGTIAELADVEQQYETAMEIAAGARMQSIVVDNDEVAARSIEFLRKKNLGRATFLPLNRMIVGKPRGKALMAVKDEHAHGFAFDLVVFKNEYKGAFWYVFGDTIIVDNLQDARRLMGGVRLVDVQGDLIEASGAMIGGSRPKINLSFSGMDHKQLEEISEQLRTAVLSQDSLSENLSEIKKEIGELESTLRTIKGEIVPDAEQATLDVQKKEFTAKLEFLSKDFEEKQQIKQDFEKRKQEIFTSIESLELKIQELDSLKEEKGKHLLKGTKKEFAQQTRILEDEVNSLQESVRSLISEQETSKKKQELIHERKTEIVQRVESIIQEILVHQESIKDLKEKRILSQNEIKALMTVDEQMTGKIKEYTQQRDMVYKQTVTLENELDKLNTRIESYIDLISRAKYRLPTLEDTIKEIEQELKMYQVEITDTKLPPVESLKDSIRVIEENMRSLEPVNMRALEEYDHQMERKKKFDEDVKHLKDQKRDLNKLVSEITEKKTERFFEIYDDINKNFKTIYGQLSEGGEAELELQDIEHLFESGLTIKARPRGKKVLRLEALSGGEKSIASLAFIFSIQAFDPSPFYVLDEVDMFLDGVNAEIISRMIKRNAVHSQFITVSLRKVVLKEANQVYGVTMQDEGISQMFGNINPDLVGQKGEIHKEEL